MRMKEMRDIAMGAVRSELRRQGRDPKCLQEYAALNVLDDIARAEPKLIASRWYLNASDLQLRWFRLEWRNANAQGFVEPVLRVKSNDKSSSYATNEQVAHLVVAGKGLTLCGVDQRPWLTKEVDYLGGALLCAKCENRAKIRSLEIPK